MMTILNQKMTKVGALPIGLDLRRMPCPDSMDNILSLDAPVVRERIAGQPCRELGKVFSFSAEFFMVAAPCCGEVLTKKIKRDRDVIHTRPCPDCRDYEG